MGWTGGFPSDAQLGGKRSARKSGVGAGIDDCASLFGRDQSSMKRGVRGHFQLIGDPLITGEPRRFYRAGGDKMAGLSSVQAPVLLQAALLLRRRERSPAASAPGASPGYEKVRMEGGGLDETRGFNGNSSLPAVDRKGNENIQV